MRDDPIACVLDDLLKLDDILACMVARRNMISVMPTAEGFKPEVNQVWDIIKRAMDDVFGVIREYSAAGLGEMEFRLQDYEALFYVFPDTENALVATNAAAVAAAFRAMPARQVRLYNHPLPQAGRGDPLPDFLNNANGLVPQGKGRCQAVPVPVQVQV